MNGSDMVDAYIAACSVDVQVLLNQIRSAIREEAPDATEKISYGMPTFHVRGNLVHFAANKNHIGFYPAPSGITAFLSEIEGSYAWSKGAVQFPLDKPLPLDLVRRMTRFRYGENLKKKG